MNHILVVADLLDKNPVVIQQANTIAQQQDVSLNFVFFCHENIIHLGADVEYIKSQILEKVTEQSKALLDQYVSPNVNYTHQVIWEKRIHEWVCRYIEDKPTSMVIKTGHRSETLLYTSTDWHLLRECQAPIYISSEKQWRNTQHVLAALDLETVNEEKQALNDKIIVEAQRQANVLNSELHVCYTIPFSSVLRDFGMLYKDEVELKAKKQLAPVIEKLAEQLSIPVSHFHLKAGEPEKVIPSVAADVKAAVVVLGMIGRKGLSGRLIGNTAEKILGLLKTDVLAIKP